MESALHALHRKDGKLLAWFDPPFPRNESAPCPDMGSQPPAFPQKIDLSGMRSGELCVVHQFDIGFYLLITSVTLDKPRIGRIAGEDLIEFHYKISNQFELEGAWGKLRVEQSQLLFWYQPDGFDDVSETISDRAREICVGLYCSPQWLKRTFGKEEPLPEIIESIVDRRMNNLCYVLRPFYPGTMQILDAIVHGTFEGLSSIRAYAKALDLLFLSLAALGSTPNTEGTNFRLTDRDLANVARARDILGAEYANPPSLHLLARRVGLNTTKLPYGFKRRYGLTIQDFIRRARLERALDLLSTTNLQIGQVAAEVGYSHHSTFTAAFVDHFGCPPRAVVNGRNAFGKAPPGTRE